MQTPLLRFVACVDLLWICCTICTTSDRAEGNQSLQQRPTTDRSNDVRALFRSVSIENRKKASARRAVKISSAADVFVITGGRVTATPSSRTNRIIKVKLGESGRLSRHTHTHTHTRCRSRSHRSRSSYQSSIKILVRPGARFTPCLTRTFAPG